MPDSGIVIIRTCASNTASEMNRTLVILLALLLPAGLLAGEKGSWYDYLDYGVEWGYTASFWETYHYNYTSPSQGARIDSRDSRFAYKSNGHVYAFAGARFARHFALDGVIGWAGLYEERRMVPVTLRSSFFFKSYDQDGLKAFLEGGCCLGESFAGKPVGIGKLGGGYRVMLDRHFALDLALSLQGVSDHPLDVYDRKREEAIPEASLRRSDCGYLSVNFSISLCF